MALLGLLASFLPQEMLEYIGYPVSTASVVLLQITGALFLGFAMLNWAARGVLIGGIYARPLAMGNFLHFVVGAVTLLKAVDLQSPPETLLGTLAYAVFAAWFGMVVFTRPKLKESAAE